MSFWKSEHFKALQHLWYERLRASGFKDEEQIRGNEMQLRQWSHHMFDIVPAKTLKFRQQYYLNISHYVESAKFNDPIDEFILRSHAAGWFIKEICEELERRGQCRHRHTVRYTIRRYLNDWGLAKFSQEQMNRVNKVG